MTAVSICGDWSRMMSEVICGKHGKQTHAECPKCYDELYDEVEKLRMFIWHSGAVVPCRCCIDSLGYDPCGDPEAQQEQDDE